jgi:hypothetical protein
LIVLPTGLRSQKWDSMAGRGPAPKPAALRQRTNRKVGATNIEAPEHPAKHAIPNPDGRAWHPLTLAAWEHAWRSPMSSQWLETDIDALGRLALLWDALYLGHVAVMAEIRLQESRFGLSPLDRSRLQWEVARGDEAERKTKRPAAPKASNDPRKILRMAAG